MNSHPQGFRGGGSVRSRSGTKYVLGLYIRASLSFRMMNSNICTPKTTNEAARAVTKAIRLIPCCAWALPTAEEVVAVAASLVVDAAADIVVDILRT